MKLVTKGFHAKEYDCKLIDYIHGEPEHENEVQILLYDNTIQYEELTNIGYIIM